MLNSFSAIRLLFNRLEQVHTPSFYSSLSRSHTLEEAGQNRKKRRARHVRVSWRWDEIGISCSSHTAGEHLGLDLGGRFQTCRPQL